MSGVERSRPGKISQSRVRACLLAGALGALGAACTTNLGKIDSPGFSLGGEAAEVPPIQTEPMRNSGASLIGGGEGGHERAATRSTVDVGALPHGAPDGTERHAMVDPVAAPPMVASEHWIEVRRGDTLYGLARKHKISVAEIKSLNGIKGTMLKPGQKLAISRAVKPGRAASFARAGAEGVSPPRTTLARGDARRGKGVADRQPGVPPSPVESAPRVVTTRPIILNPSEPKAAVAPPLRTASASEAGVPPLKTASDPARPEAQSDGKLRWPVRGRIISGFGRRPDGTRNDGINLAVPRGTEVHAAESGTVAYSGDEKGYGKLVLVRHDNGWVTAYAHNDELLVRKGERIERGQILAKAGKTGQVDQPQLHFELRQNLKPVDPAPFLEQL